MNLSNLAPLKNHIQKPQAGLSLLTFCSKLIKIPVEDLFKDKLEITVNQMYAVLIARVFASYERPSNTELRLSGIVPTEVLADSFAVPLEIIRVRLVISMDENGIAKGLTKIDDDFALANIVHQDGKTIITLFEGTTMNVVDLIARNST